MRWLFLFLIALFTLIGGIIPIRLKRIESSVSSYLLSFTGAYLLGITLIHLAPESFGGLGEKAGVFILLGYLLQIFLQRWSHGLEHGHLPHGEIYSHMPVHGSTLSIVIGLSAHAFIEGIPLGFIYHNPSTQWTLSLGILLHKIPEALTLIVMLLHLGISKKTSGLLLLAFSFVTPLGATLTYFLNMGITGVQSLMSYFIAVVAGAFLHISTTILFESGTGHHALSKKKFFSVIFGFLLALATLFLE